MATKPDGPKDFGGTMSKKSRQRKWRRVEAQKRQLALNPDVSDGGMSENTIGDLRLLLTKMGGAKSIEVAPTVPSQIALATSNLPVAPVPVTPPAPQVVLLPGPAHWPACPVNCDAAEWRRAMEHHDYYLQCAEKDNNAKPWFQYPRVVHQYSEFVYITPEMAQKLLDYNPINRKIKMGHVEGLKRDIQNHRWLQTHESIAVNKLGNMHDGQHRALAIIKAWTGWPIYLTWNVPPEGIYATDSGDKRPINEKLGFLFPDLKMTNKTAALCRSMMWGLSNRGLRYTESEIASFMLKHQRVINWIMTNVRSKYVNYRADLQAVIGKGMLWWGEEIVGPFVERLRTVQFCGEGDPAKALYLWLQNSKKQKSNVPPVIYYKKALAAIHAHALKRDAKRIISKEQDIFEWLPGWNIPDDALCAGKVFIHSDENQP